MKNGNRISKDEMNKRKSDVCDLYTSGKTIKEVSLELGLTYRQVEYIVNILKISRKRGPQNLTKNLDFFKRIDTERKSYFLGWIMADANVSNHNNQYSLKIHISSKDIDILNSFMDDIKSDNKISKRVVNEKEYVYTSITSKEMVEDLMRHGVVPNKSTKEKIPNIRKELIPHFIRGYFDGDGITCVKNIKRSGFVGGYEMLKQIQDETNIKKSIFQANNSKAFYYLMGMKESHKLYEYMYKDATVFSLRKKQRMDIICEKVLR